MHPRLHEKLIVWQASYALCLFVYRITRSFPSCERFGLISQMRRSAYIIPTNIAEGNAKRTKPDKVRFIDIAIGSLEELHCESRLSRDLSYCTQQHFSFVDDQVNRISFLLHRLRSSLQN